MLLARVSPERGEGSWRGVGRCPCAPRPAAFAPRGRPKADGCSPTPTAGPVGGPTSVGRDTPLARVVDVALRVRSWRSAPRPTSCHPRLRWATAQPPGDLPVAPTGSCIAQCRVSVRDGPVRDPRCGRHRPCLAVPGRLHGGAAGVSVGPVGADRVAGRPHRSTGRGRAVAAQAAAGWEPRGAGPSRGVRGGAPRGPVAKRGAGRRPAGSCREAGSGAEPRGVAPGPLDSATRPPAAS